MNLSMYPHPSKTSSMLSRSFHWYIYHHHCSAASLHVHIKSHSKAFMSPHGQFSLQAAVSSRNTKERIKKNISKKTSNQPSLDRQVHRLTPTSLLPFVTETIIKSQRIKKPETRGLWVTFTAGNRPNYNNTSSLL